MQYARHADDCPDGTLFAVEGFTQRLVTLDGERHEASCDEILYVLEGTGSVRFGEEEHDVRPGTAILAACETTWEARGDARAVSVLVHSPEPSTSHAVADLGSVERRTPT